MALRDADKNLAQRVKLFKELVPSEIEMVLEQGEEQCFAPGETVFHEGAEGTVLYIVLEGVVAIRVRGNYLAKCKAGDAFGEMAVLNRRPRSATATAVTEVRLLCLDEGAIQKILDREVAVRFLLNVILVISQRLEAGNAWATVTFEELRQKKGGETG